MKNKVKVFVARQGDVLVEQVSSIPKGLEKQKPIEGRIILAHGEVTGHHHSVEADAADWWKKDDNEQFIAVNKPTEIVHQEHGSIALPTGKYRVLRQREYSPEAIRRVED